MKKTLFTILSIAVWVALLVYLVFAVRMCRREKAGIVVERVEIRVKDSQQVRVVSEAMVGKWIEEAGFELEQREVMDVNTEHIRAAIAQKPFVKDVRVYSDMRGVIHVDLTQRKPIARFNTANGYNFYLSDDGWILPIPQGSAVHVPVVTGNFRMPFERGYFGSLADSLASDEKNRAQDYAFMLKLINFVRLTEEDSFWNSQIVQIVVSQKGAEGRWKEPEVEFVPRVGNFVVGLGTLVDVGRKLEKLMLFYHNVLPYEGWDSYRYVNLKYGGQIVCTK